jgi:hypothetical protein
MTRYTVVKGKTMSRLSEKQFLKEVEGHRMQVLLDNGIYRHLRFAQEGQNSWNQWFDIVTWPGRLAYTGDMGTFVFARLEDMFQFFRGKPSDHKGLYVNLGYWAEKLEAADCRGGCQSGAEEYSPDRFKAMVNEHVEEWIGEFSGEYDSSDEEAAKGKQAFADRLREEVKDQVLHFADDGEAEAHRVLRGFKLAINGKEFQFSDTWEWDLRDYTFRFVWCCHALNWAIQQYDAAKEGVAA